MEMNKPSIVMLFVQLVYTGMALLSKSAIAHGMNPYVFVVYRQAIATLFLAPFAFFLDRLLIPSFTSYYPHELHHLISLLTHFLKLCFSNKSARLSYNLLWKIFLVSLFGHEKKNHKKNVVKRVSFNLFYVALDYTSATFAAASTNLIPAITFVIAVLLRHIKQYHGLSKVLGTIVGVSGAFVFAFVKGPPLKFMSFSYPANPTEVSIWFSSKGDLLKGSLMMLSANTVWSFWLIMQAWLTKQYPAKLRLVTLQCFFSCIQSAIWAIAMERNMSSWKLGWDANLFSVVYCGIVVVGITYWLQLWAIERKGPVFTAMFTPLALILTAIFSAILWKEILHLGSVCGAILLAGGLYGVLWGKNTEVKTKPNEEQAEKEEEPTLECIVHN
ncbi:hypothetical protein RJ639_000563 [Escallonia herrerae]|uniref:WAT1-related protein n=1 Tax=Escallonia herrerae TaxID=1293975 RepID=A0AA88XG88_9ASTE|nr:hypothetical protein RJ639_000563 [Escallonia herrerae]